MPTSANTGSMSSVPAITTKTAMTTSNTNELPSVRSTRARLPSPSWMAASALPPWPASIEKPMRMVMTGNASVVTATPTSPTAWPRKAVSTTLYSELNTMLMMAGMENSSSSLPTRSVPMRSVLALAGPELGAGAESGAGADSGVGAEAVAGLGAEAAAGVEAASSCRSSFFCAAASCMCRYPSFARY